MLTKVLEWGRLMAYLEQSTRYIAYNQPPHHRPLPLLPRPGPARLAARCPLRRRDGPDVRHLRRAARRGPGLAGGPPPPPARGLRLRPPPGGPGQGPRRPPGPAPGRPRCPTSGSTAPGSPTRCCCCGCAPIRCPRPASYAELMLEELRKVIPSFLQRVDRPDRGGVWSDVPGPRPGRRPAQLVDELFPDLVSPADHPVGGPVGTAVGDPARLRPRRRGQGHRRHLRPAHRPVRGGGARAGSARLGAEEKRSLLRAYVGERANRRHRPGRAFERTDYRFDVVTDYGAFRDLQRHRMLTIEWQPLGTTLGYDVPEVVEEAGLAEPLRGLAGAVAGAGRGDWPRPSPRSRPTPWPWPTGSATRCR